MRRRSFVCGVWAACSGAGWAQSVLPVMPVMPAGRSASSAGAASAPLATHSADGRWRFAAEPGGLAVWDRATGQRLRAWPATALGAAPGAVPGQVSALHPLAARRSVLVAFDGLAEWWELSTNPQAEPIFDGLVHDYRMAEGIATPGFLNPRRTRLDLPLRDLVFADNPAWVIGRAPDRADGRAVLQVWHLDARRRIAERVFEGDPQLGIARRQQTERGTVLVIPDAAGGPAQVLDWPPR